MRFPLLILLLASTAPAASIWHATTQPALGSDGSEARPMDVRHCFAFAKPGDTVLLHSGQTFGDIIFVARKSNIAVGVYAGTDFATFLVPSIVGGQEHDGATLLACDDWSFDSIQWIQQGRNPDAPDFKVQPGSNGIHLIGSARPKFHNCRWLYFQNDIVAEANGIAGGVLDHCYVGPSYSVTVAHSQGMFLSGQQEWMLVDSDFDTNGWNPKVKEAPANQFNHAVYSHHDDATNGTAYTALRCRFRNASDCGPTADTGAVIDSCRIEYCANTGAGWNAWVGGKNGKIINTVSIGGSLRIDSMSGEIAHNLVIPQGDMPAIGIDLPHVKVAPFRARGPGDAVSVHDNWAWGASEVVHVYKGGPAVTVQNNLPAKR